MAGKHQIWSSNKRTRQKANRCWRRQNKVRLRDEPLTDPEKVKGQQADGQALKRGDLVHGDPATFGMALGDLISDACAEAQELVEEHQAERKAVQKERDVTAEQFISMIARWSECTIDDFRRIMDDQPEELLLSEFQQFELTPLDYFVSLPPAFQQRWVEYLSKK